MLCTALASTLVWDRAVMILWVSPSRFSQLPSLIAGQIWPKEMIHQTQILLAAGDQSGVAGQSRPGGYWLFYP